ncbi:unnamed protein product (macronuclear) [Paramecium tetraurelia]|uniref:Calcium-dependent protein kinase 1 n=1 Tax=Paramecium tetraurelia TaxID=5888 RepID=A0E7F5_PARTE|nr:uncharacterized protein GSPATT00023950001 [Paramecium tetraurelia]CAK91222.1 unnamed protein product [Paramecium tetraurelia]|eukprot:XP_001458619.1 hypothetical protein (macronuclear) [Paramecium tetraurelia strain d4-2]
MGACNGQPKRVITSKRESLTTFHKTQEVSTIKSNKSLVKQRTDFRVAPCIFVSLKSGDISQYYEIESTLGEGTFGRVSLVKQKSTNIFRAMKQLAKDKILASQRERMIQEVNILKDLDHPNIVNIFELYQDERYYYLITEYLSGGELFDRIQQRNNLNESMAANYMKQILNAVNYCHHRNIVHRDLKPENILFDQRGSDQILKIIDFGTAKQILSNTQLKQKTGTPYFIAPEVIDQNYNSKCDVWSCGVILYIMMCGKPPFKGNNLEELYRNIKNGYVDFTGSEWYDVSQDAKSFISKLLVVDPAKRMSAEQALKDTWIVSNKKVEKINAQNLENLSQFHNNSKLSSAILQLISTQIMTQKEKKELIKGFNAIDKNGDGKLSKDELIQCYMDLYQDEVKCHQIVNQIFQYSDVDCSGTIEYTEFIVAFSEVQNLMAQEKLQQAFKLFDKDGNGTISKGELQEVFGGLALNDNQLDCVFSELDTNGDGVVTFQEFTQLLMKDSNK